MCGIAVVINYGGEKIDPSFLRGMFHDMANRGSDASGIYFEREEGGRTIRRLFEGPMESKDLWRLLQEPSKKDLKMYGSFINKYALTGKEKFLMFHTRAKTRGDEKAAHNNMPIFSDNYFLVHNGMVSNKRLEKYQYKGEVDSEEILASVETYGVAEGLSQIAGSMAIGLKPKKENVVYLYRNSNPLDVLYFKEQGLLVACSSGSYVKYQEKDFGAELLSATATAQKLPAFHLFKVSTIEPKLEIVKKIDPVVEAQAATSRVVEAWYGRLGEEYIND